MVISHVVEQKANGTHGEIEVDTVKHCSLKTPNPVFRIFPKHSRHTDIVLNHVSGDSWLNLTHYPGHHVAVYFPEIIMNKI